MRMKFKRFEVIVALGITPFTKNDEYIRYMIFNIDWHMTINVNHRQPLLINKFYVSQQVIIFCRQFHANFYLFIQFGCKNSTILFNLTAKIVQIAGIIIKKIELFVIILQNVKIFGNFAKIAQEFYLFFSQYFTPPRGKNAVFSIYF